MKDLIYSEKGVEVTLIKVSPRSWYSKDSTLPFYLLVLSISIISLAVIIFKF